MCIGLQYRRHYTEGSNDESVADSEGFGSSGDEKHARNNVDNNDSHILPSGSEEETTRFWTVDAYRTTGRGLVEAENRSVGAKN